LAAKKAAQTAPAGFVSLFDGMSSRIAMVVLSAGVEGFAELAQCVREHNLDNSSNIDDGNPTRGPAKPNKSPVRGAKEEVSLRMTIGPSFSLFSKGSKAKALKPRLQSRVVEGVKGASLGYHLVESSEGKEIITLFGTAENFLHDVSFVDSALDLLNVDKGNEVMSLRLQHPSRLAFGAVASSTSEVYYEFQNDAIYPVRWGMHGNEKTPWNQALGHVTDILKVMSGRSLSECTLKASEFVLA